MSEFSTDFAVGIGLLKSHHGDAITYTDENDADTAITNAIFIPSDEGETDDGRGRAVLLSARVLIDVTDLAAVDRRGKIKLDSTSDEWEITSLETVGGVHRITVERRIRDDFTVGEFRV